MADAASACRRTTRASQQPLSLAEEQAAVTLSALEQRDVAAALRLSLQDSWDSDEEKSGAERDAEAESSSSEEEEEKQAAAPAEEEEEWTDNLHAVDVPLPRLRHERQPAPAEDTPLRLLQRFLPPALMEEFAQHTNAAAPHDWRPSTAAELYAFLGAHLFMGIDRLPRTELYWSSTFGHPLITSLFSRDRFKQLLRFFRVVAPDEDAAERNPLPHVRALAEKLNASFAAHAAPSQHLTLDEAMVAYKGRSPIKQYIPSKPHKWGYKIWCLASEDYLLHFEVYAGKEEAPSDAGATIDTVIRMTAAYQHQQHVMYVDNWFTSPALLHALAQKGIRLCGSVRRNRKGMPAIPAADVRALGRGEWIQRQKGDATVAVWRDQQPLWVLYNPRSPSETASLDRWSDAGRKVSIGCPRAVRDYFYHARSVDVLSQHALRLPPGSQSAAIVASLGMVAARHVRHQRLPALVERAAASGTAPIPRGAHARACSADASRAEASPSKQATRTRRFTSQGSLPRARADAKRLRAVQPTIRKASTILVHLSHLPSTSLLQRLLRIVSRVERNCASHDIIKA